MCRIALVNCSPKGTNSSSQCILDELRQYIALHPGCTVTNYEIKGSKLEAGEEIVKHDRIVFAFPLYVDGPPSHMIGALMEMEKFALASSGKAQVYAVCNCGFFEGQQAATALDVLENWCLRAGLQWGQGLGIGGGGMVTGIKGVAPGHGPRKNISSRLNVLAAYVKQGNLAVNDYTAPNFPRLLYKKMAEVGWRKQIKANGLKAGAISMQR